MPPRAAAKGMKGPAVAKKKAGVAATVTIKKETVAETTASRTEPPALPVSVKEEPRGMEATMMAAAEDRREDAPEAAPTEHGEPAADAPPSVPAADLPSPAYGSADPAPSVPVTAADQPFPAFGPSPPPRPFLQSVDELRRLSVALDAFTRGWNDLQCHLDSIQVSMDALSRDLDRRCTESLREKAVVEEKKGGGGGEEGKEGGEREEENKEEREKKFEEEEEKEQEKEQKSRSELESICQEMQGRNLRRYLVAHMSEVDRLREEVPAAIKLAPNPARLVLSCIGRFYLQGSKAYEDSNSPMVSCRRACILMLEFFLLSGCCNPSSYNGEDASNSNSIWEEAKVAALAWRSRIVGEGGFALASAVDSLGLALFTASFGIPREFDSGIVYNMLQRANLRKKADILRRSPILAQKMPDIIQDLVQHKNFVAAADLSCAFDLKEKYPPLPLLSSLMNKTDKTAGKERQDGQCSLRSLKEATENQLAAYKSVFKCLEDHKLDTSALASFKIEDKMAKLEKEIQTFDRKLKDKNMKRKADDVKPTNKQEVPAKRQQLTTVEAAVGRDSSLVKLNQDWGSAPAESRNLGFLPGKTFSGRFPGLLDGTGTGQPVGSIFGSTGFGGGPGVADGRVVTSLGDDMRSSYGSGLSVGNGVGPFMDSRGALYGAGSLTDSRGAMYGWYHRGGPSDSAVGRSFSGLPDPTGTNFSRPSEQSSLVPSEQRGLVGPPPAPGQNLSQPAASSLELGSKTSGPNVYQFADGPNVYRFADTVSERESYYDHSGGAGSALPPTHAPGYHSSYLI